MVELLTESRLTWEQVRTAHPLWFSKDAMEWSQSRIETDLIDGPRYTYFISSEQDSTGIVWDGLRRYTVRMISRLQIHTIGSYGQFPDYDSALVALRMIVQTQEIIDQGEHLGYLEPLATGASG